MGELSRLEGVGVGRYFDLVIYLVLKYLLNGYFELGIVLGVGDTVVKEVVIRFVFVELF